MEVVLDSEDDEDRQPWSDPILDDDDEQHASPRQPESKCESTTQQVHQDCRPAYAAVDKIEELETVRPSSPSIDDRGEAAATIYSSAEQPIVEILLPSIAVETQASPPPPEAVRETDNQPIHQSTRQLRPRTYAQQHPVEYEYAKYIKMCRETGMKPVPLYGFSTKDVDKDFVPPTRNEPQERAEKESRSNVHNSPRRQVLSDTTNTIRPAIGDRNVQTTPQRLRRRVNPPDSIFDFPTTHWADTVEPLTTPLSNESSSDESEAAAIARYRRKLKGVLPPSYLSKRKDTELHKQPARPQIAAVISKGVAKRKVMVLSQSPSVVEAEEPIDLMLPTPPRSRRQRQPVIFLQDVLRARPSLNTKELRLARRRTRRNSHGTQLNRKTIALHDSDSDVVETLKDWRAGTLSFTRPASRKKRRVNRDAAASPRKISSGPRSARKIDYARHRQRRSDVQTRLSPVQISPPRSVSTHSPHEHVSIDYRPITFPAYTARTFSGHLEHETGRMAEVVRKTKSKYFQRFNDINNIFGQEPDVLEKVSNWQLQDLRATSPQPVARKKRLLKVSHVQQTVLPFTEQTNGFKFPKTLSILYGAEPVHKDTYFNADTFVGSGVLVGVVKQCYLGHVLQDNVDDIEHGFSSLPSEPFDFLRFIATTTNHSELIIRRCMESHTSVKVQNWLYLVALLHGAEPMNCFKYLLTTGFGAVTKALRRQRNQLHRRTGIGSSDDESFLELWVVLIHVCDRSERSFWSRLNEFLELPCPTQALTERAWNAILQLASVTQLTQTGTIGNASHNWSAVDQLLRPEYMGTCIKRVYALAFRWRWPKVDKILGHGRTDGKLHSYLLDNLGQFASQLPYFIVQNQNEYQEQDDEYTMALKIVSRGINQHIAALDYADRERAKRRGIGVVDKFTTHGRLNYAADEEISKRVVCEIRNRFSLEIAVWWAAGDLKDRGLTRVINATKASISNSHLAIRDINIAAWKLVSQKDKSSEILEWFDAVYDSVVQDVVKFMHEMRTNKHDARLQSSLRKNIIASCETLTLALEAFRDSGITPDRDITSVILSQHNYFDEKTLNSALALIKAHVSQQHEDSQSYGFSQDENPNDRSEMYLPSLFKLLTNVLASERITSKNVLLAQSTIELFVVIVASSDIPSVELFDKTGQYSWYRLLDNTMKANMVPFFLVSLLRRSLFILHSAKNHVYSAWLTTLVRPSITESMSELTELLSPSLRLTGLNLKIDRLAMFIRFLEQPRELLVEALLDVANVLKYDLLQSNFEPAAVCMTQQVLGCIHQYHPSLVIGPLQWLSDPLNVPQRHPYIADQFRGYKAAEILMTLLSRCDTDILECKADLDDFLCAALLETPLQLAIPPAFDTKASAVRSLSMTMIHYLNNQRNVVATIYAKKLTQSMIKVYRAIPFDVSTEVRPFLPHSSSDLNNLFPFTQCGIIPSINTDLIDLKISDWTISETHILHNKRNKSIALANVI